MPASMISAPTGGRPNVIGSSIAIVATVPIPGNTPTRVPTSAPSKQNRTFIGENATPKPSARFERSSDMANLNRDASAQTGNELRQDEQEALEQIRELVEQQLRCVCLRPELERQVQKIDEQQHTSQGHRCCCDQALDPSHFPRSRDRDHEGKVGRNDQPERTDERGKE